MKNTISKEQIISDLAKVIDAVGEINVDPNGIAVITEVEGEIVSIKHKDLYKYEYKNGVIKLKQNETRRY